MRFHRPFDDVQLSVAVERHQRMRANLQELRRKHPPRSIAESRRLKVYRDMIQAFGRELLKPIDRIDPDHLNELSRHAIAAFVEYAIARQR
jgi:hypothetical protein